MDDGMTKKLVEKIMDVISKTGFGEVKVIIQSGKIIRIEKTISELAK